jgi:predicted DNA-binding transcriptional regulator YafY
MERSDVEQLTALLQAHLVALTALLATHPDPAALRPAFETIAASSKNPHPEFQLSLAMLRKAIPSH